MNRADFVAAFGRFARSDRIATALAGADGVIIDANRPAREDFGLVAGAGLPALAGPPVRDLLRRCAGTGDGAFARFDRADGGGAVRVDAAVAAPAGPEGPALLILRLTDSEERLRAFSALPQRLRPERRGRRQPARRPVPRPRAPSCRSSRTIPSCAATPKSVCAVLATPP